jgi:hypothetical protein
MPEVEQLVPGEVLGAFNRVGWSNAWRSSRALNCHRAWTLDPGLGFRARVTRCFGPRFAGQPVGDRRARRFSRARTRGPFSARERAGWLPDQLSFLDAWLPEERQVAVAMRVGAECRS